MRLLVIGASGRTGRILTALALEHGHDVTALVRDPVRSSLPINMRLHIIRGDVLAPDTLSPAVAGQDAIVSLLAPRPRINGRVYVDGTRNLADAAEAAGVRRLVAVSAEGAGVSAGSLPRGYRALLHLPVIARLYPDIAAMERELTARGALDWTIVRPAVLINRGRSKAFRTSPGDVVPHGLWISRTDLAAFLLDIVEQGEYVRQRVAVAH